MNNKLLITLKVIKYFVNPLASLRNPLAPFSRIKSMLAKRQQGKILYTEFKMDESLDTATIEQKCKQLKTMSRIAFTGAGLLAISALMLTAFQQTSFILIIEVITSMCFASMFLALSLKYAFLANGIENNQFKYENPLEFAKQNWGAYITWLFSPEYQLQRFK
jgi:hypothetical protein